KVLRELRDDLSPEVAVHEETVHEADRLARAALPIADRSLLELRLFPFAARFRNGHLVYPLVVPPCSHGRPLPSGAHARPCPTSTTRPYPHTDSLYAVCEVSPYNIQTVCMSRKGRRRGPLPGRAGANRRPPEGCSWMQRVCCLPNAATRVSPPRRSCAAPR